MSSSEKLYTPELLALTVRLAEFPPRPDLALHGSARSQSCGSTLDVDLDLDKEARISQIGFRVQSCAIGQASAFIFAEQAIGRDEQDIRAARDRLRDWLSGDETAPDWPGIEKIGAARAFPGRHGAILLAWNASLDAFAHSSLVAAQA
ncbi:iron-sulfur cluster assembly scaffold protein [Altericroceibacterium endophyticum]|uniref:Iron-sulfur cluster assembly scaffold protein n=1 Tax=Altericroceibacterium endophyticum TaxID=1808508 RepID=A0A6I4T0Q7_9SPHN|nr:iron-sulfur cluster assembly scaffold protein [Altericroceibacterium endophyticum]MXO64486.1 iron-sulfur cluster assembly scaffold protein [Altericroceibacterium endophyticum]